MMLTNSVQLEQLQLFSQSFPQALGMCLWKFLNILTEGHSWDHTLMLDEKTWLTVSALIPKVLWIWGQDSALPSQALRHQTHSCVSLWTCFCAHCFWVHLKTAWFLEVCSDWLYRRPVASAHYARQYPLNLLCDFYMAYNILCYNTTRSWLQSS